MADGRRINLLEQGRLINLAAAEGHPASVMDMSFAVQALTSEYVVNNDISLGVHPVPPEIDDQVARLKLAALNITLEELTPKQVKYLASWKEGT